MVLLMVGAKIFSWWLSPDPIFDPVRVPAQVAEADVVPVRGYEALRQTTEQGQVKPPENVTEELWAYVQDLRGFVSASLAKTLPDDVERSFIEPQAIVEYNPAVEGPMKNVPISCLLKADDETVPLKSGAHLLCRCSPDPPEGMMVALSRDPFVQDAEGHVRNNWAYVLEDGHDMLQLRWKGTTAPNQTFRISFLHETIHDLNGWIKPVVDGGIPCLQMQIKLPECWDEGKSWQISFEQIPAQTKSGRTVTLEVAGVFLQENPSGETGMCALWQSEGQPDHMVRFTTPTSFRTSSDGMSNPSFGFTYAEGGAGILLLSIRPLIQYSTVLY